MLLRSYLTEFHSIFLAPANWKQSVITYMAALGHWWHAGSAFHSARIVTFNDLNEDVIAIRDGHRDLSRAYIKT